MIRHHTYTVYVVKCDGCGTQNRSVSYAFGLVSQAYADALANGWLLANGPEHHDYCPRCIRDRGVN